MLQNFNRRSHSNIKDFEFFGFWSHIRLCHGICKVLQTRDCKLGDVDLLCQRFRGGFLVKFDGTIYTEEKPHKCLASAKKSLENFLLNKRTSPYHKVIHNLPLEAPRYN